MKDFDLSELDMTATFLQLKQEVREIVSEVLALLQVYNMGREYPEYFMVWAGKALTSCDFAMSSQSGALAVDHICDARVQVELMRDAFRRPTELVATLRDSKPGGTAAVVVRGKLISYTLRSHPDIPGESQALMQIKADDWTWELDRIDADQVRLKSECLAIEHAGGVKASGEFSDTKKHGLSCIVDQWQPWRPESLLHS